MRFRRTGAFLAMAAVLSLSCQPAFADNYTVRDGQGALQTFGSKVLGVVQYPIHLLYGLFGSTPTPVNVDGSGNVGVNVQSAPLPTGASTAANQTTGNASLGSLDSKTPALGQNTKTGSTPVALPTDPDVRTAAANITAVDAATSTVSGQGSVTLITGTPTANSATTWTINGASSVTIGVSGTFTATAQIEASADCVLYGPANAKLLGSGLVVGSVTAPGVFRVDATGMACVRLRASAFTSGPLVALANASTAPGLSQVLNPVRLSDTAGAAMGVSGNPLVANISAALPAGTNLLGKTGIDQTTPGTTNNVAASSIQGSIVVTPTVTASSAYASGNTLGGLLTLTGAMRTSGGTALLQKVVISNKSNQMAPTDILIFNANPSGTTVTDKTAVAVAVADFNKVIGVVHVTDCTNIGTPSVCQASGLALSLIANGSADLYAVAVTRGTPTFTATTDVSISFVFIKD